MIKVAFFDVDGLLVDSEKLYNECWVEASKMIGYGITPEQALELRSLDSTLASEKFKEWFSREGIYELIRKKRKDIMNNKLQNANVKAKKGVKEIISDIKKRGIKVVVVTSATVIRAKEYLNRAGINISFDKIVSTELVRKGKPYPDVYYYAADAMGVETKECISFEDSPNGLKSAHKAGCRTIMIPDLSGLNDEISQWVDYCFDDLLVASKELDIIICNE